MIPNPENNHAQSDNAATSNENPKTPAFDIVALTASAHGLDALTQVLSSLVAEFPVPIVVVQHLSPKYPSLFAPILNRRTALEVIQAEEGGQLRAGLVMIAPPDNHLLVNSDGSVSLSQTEKVHFVRPAAEVLFESVAKNYKQRAIAVVLTGADRDGSQGVQLIKQAGGKVIAQDKATSKVWGMPSAAIATGCVDWVLPLNEISTALTNLVLFGQIKGQIR